MSPLFFDGFFSERFFPLYVFFYLCHFPLVNVGHPPPKSIDVCVPPALSSVI